MFEVKTLDSGIIEVIHEGEFTIQNWRDYQETLLEMLDASSETLYILSNFSGTTIFAKEIVPEVGTARHLSHPRLGLIVLLGGNALQNFILALTEHRAQKQESSSRLRVHKDYDRAVEVLEYQRSIDRAAAAS